MNKFLSLLLTIFFGLSLSAQDSSTIFHRTFDLKEVNGISLSTHANDSVRIEPWVGNQLLIETNVKLLNGKKPLLKHFLEKGRWALDTLMAGDQLQFAAHDPVRNVLTNAGTEVVDVVRIVVYMPDDFESSGPNSWARKEE
ncbi:MAG: hypothetical protein AAF741_15400 [Bacteroidota bacterium]